MTCVIHFSTFPTSHTHMRRITNTNEYMLNAISLYGVQELRRRIRAKIFAATGYARRYEYFLIVLGYSFQSFIKKLLYRRGTGRKLISFTIVRHYIVT